MVRAGFRQAGEEKFIFFNSKQKKSSFITERRKKCFSGIRAARRYGIYFSPEPVYFEHPAPHRHRADRNRRDQIKVQEDVKLKIGVASVWDGAYWKTDPALQDSQKGDEEMVNSPTLWLRGKANGPRTDRRFPRNVRIGYENSEELRKELRRAENANNAILSSGNRFGQRAFSPSASSTRRKGIPSRRR